MANIEGSGALEKSQHVQAVSNTINHVNTGQLKNCQRCDLERVSLVHAATP